MHRADARAHFAFAAEELHRERARGLANFFHPSARLESLTCAHRREEIRLGVPHWCGQAVVLEPPVPTQFGLTDEILDHAMGQRDGARIEHDPCRVGILETDGDVRFKRGHGRLIAFLASPCTDKPALHCSGRSRAP